MKKPFTEEVAQLPDLPARAGAEIQVDNLIAAQALYFASMFEALNGFKVMEILLARFLQGQLPIGRGNAGHALYSYWKKRPARLTEADRRNLYVQVFGFPGGDAAGAQPNKAFNDLWLRFVRSVVEFAHQRPVSGPGEAIFTQKNLKQAARDLARNLSLHGYGIAYFAATELQTQIREVVAVLSEPEIGRAYGVRDVWGLIDKISREDLGGPSHRAKYHAMATYGSTIIRWLADRASHFNSSPNSFSPGWGVSTAMPLLGEEPIATSPADGDLIQACESWLAADAILGESSMGGIT